MSERRTGRAVRARLGRAATVAVLAGVATAVGLAARDSPDRTIAASAREDPAPLPAAAVAVPALIDGPDRPPGTQLPRDDAGERLWRALGTWWAVLPDPVTATHHIWGLAGPDGPWVDTGTFVDERLDADLQVGWDGEDLVVAATGSRPYRSHALRLHRYSWSPGAAAWVGAADHPLEITTTGEPGFRMALTPDGTAWFVRARGATLEVGRTAGRAARWGGWAPLDLGDAAGDVGGFDLVVDGGDVVVVARRRSVDALVVSRRQGDAWTSRTVPVPDVRGVGPVDASAAPAGGSLTALVPTTVAAEAAGSQAPHLLLVGLEGARAQPSRVAVVSRSADRLEQAALLVDGTRAVVVAVAPPSPDDVRTWGAQLRTAPTALVVKEAPLADPVFAPGSGRRVASGVDGADLARPLLPVALAPGDGLVVVASGRDAHRWTTWTDHVAPAVPPPRPAVAGGETVLVADTFDTLLPGAPGPGAWSPEDADPPGGVVEDDPVTGSQALRIEGGADPPAVCRPIPELPAATVTVTAVLRAEGTGTADARLLTVKGSGGSVASVRQSRLGLVGWSTGEGRVTGRAAPPGAALHVTLRLDVATRTSSVEIRTTAGEVLAAGAGIPWLTASDHVDELCVRAAPGPGTAVLVDDVRVTQV